ncbi:MAG: hypothetical protein ACW98Y_11210 [Candidatus Thorarchaeota archaeon]|jgi:hypothetical protein
MSDSWFKVSVLLILSLIILTPQTVNTQSHSAKVDISLTSACSIYSDIGSNFTISWNSTESPSHTAMTNDTMVIGNNIIITTTFNDTGNSQDLKIANISNKLDWFQSGFEFDIETTIGNESSYSVPWLSYNITGNLTIETTTFNGTIYEQTLYNLTFNNTFAPHVTSIAETHDGAIYTITWVIQDMNVNDYFISEVLFSMDGGDTYQWLATGLMVQVFDWNSTGFMIDEFWVTIRVKDSRGLSDELERLLFWIGNGPPGPIISLSHPSDIEMIEGDLDVSIQWLLETSTSVDYHIYRNGTLVKTGHRSGGVIVHRLDELEVGTYSFILSVGPGWNQASDTVIVHVNRSIIPIISGIIIGAAIGSIVAISILLVAKRNQRI